MNTLRSKVIRLISLFFRLTQLHRIFFWVYDRFIYFSYYYIKGSKIIVLDQKRKNRLAVFAIFQPKGLSDFVISELNYLLSLGYDVAVSIPHSLNQKDQEYLDRVCRFRIARPNTGRDFGSYKDAIIKIGFDRISEYQRILLVNDSIFFPLGDTEDFEKKFFSSSAEVIGLCENSGSIRHISSFFIDIDSKLFCCWKIRQYWINYRNYNSRFYAIRKGECGFSKLLYKISENIDIIYSQENVIYTILKLLDDRRINFTQFLYLLSSDFWSKFKEKYISTKRKLNIEMAQIIFIDELRKILEFNSYTHAFGLQLFTLLNAPFLKRDLYYHGIFDLAQIKMALNIVDPRCPIDKILVSLRKKGAPQNQGIWGELMIRMGIR